MKIKMILVITLVFFCLSGCSPKGDNALKSESYLELVTTLDQLVGTDLTVVESAKKTTAYQQLLSASTDKRAEIALNLADDMAMAKFMNMITPEMLYISSEAVKAYPHPLLLNNFGALIMEEKGASEANFLFELAVQQDPTNPMILTNLANVYLDLDDYEGAQFLATEALKSESEYGPAYQVLTRVHLKNGDSILAAETMVKSARHCFDDITSALFESYLSAVKELDPLEDEYPLKEKFLDELYIIARDEKDGSYEDMGTDTPNAQLKLKPFPQISSPDHLVFSKDYLAEQISAIHNTRQSVEQELYPYADSNPFFDAQRLKTPGTMPVVKSVRQIYAIQVLTSFYDFKLQKLEALHKLAIQEIEDAKNADLEKLNLVYALKYQQIDEKIDEAMENMWADLVSSLDGGTNIDLVSTQKATLLRCLIGIDNKLESAAIYRKHSNEIIRLSEKYYNENKQILEEYWLKTGGLLKYVQSENQFLKLALEREVFVYDYLARPLYDLEYTASVLAGELESMDHLTWEYDLLADAYGLGNQMIKKSIEEDQIARDQENEKNGIPKEIVPDIEREALAIYPEEDKLSTLGAEIDLFSLVGASLKYDGEVVSITTNSVFGGFTGTIADNWSTTTSYVKSVSAQGDTAWFTSAKNVEDALTRSGKLGQAAGVLGKIGFKFLDGTSTGRYVAADTAQNITDRGSLYVRESGGEIGFIGKSRSIEVKKSFITGIATKQSSTKYKFFFATFEKSD